MFIGGPNLKKGRLVYPIVQMFVEVGGSRKWAHYIYAQHKTSFSH